MMGEGSFIRQRRVAGDKSERLLPTMREFANLGKVRFSDSARVVANCIREMLEMIRPHMPRSIDAKSINIRDRDPILIDSDQLVHHIGLREVKTFQVKKVTIGELFAFG